MSNRVRFKKAGFTLIEALVVVLIICLIAAIGIPVVISARAAARRATCLSNLNQIGLALNNYQSAMNVFPRANNGDRGFSIFCMILNEIENQNIYDSINFSVRPIESANGTVSSSKIAVLMCPANSNDEFGNQSTNYACTVGFGFQLPSQNEGVFGVKPVAHTSPAGVTDGLSSTVMASEWITGSAHRNTNLNLSNTYRVMPSIPEAKNFEKFNSVCSEFIPLTVKNVWINKGQRWIKTGLGITLYNHNLTPNKQSCLNGSLIREGSWTASSNHSDRINVLFADGHSRTISDKINLSVWRALSTKSGGEANTNILD